MVIVRGKLSVVATPDTDTKRGGIGCGPDPIKQLFGFTRVPDKKIGRIKRPIVWVRSGL